MAQRKKFSFADLLVVFFCVLAASLCVFLFWQDLHASLYRHGEQPVGIITFRYNAAQRRFVDRVIWDRLRNDSPVFNGDIIRTAALSEATVTFELGDIVEISENTLIQIFADDRGSFIDIVNGGVSVSTHETGMIIYSGDNRLTLDPGTTVQAASLESGALTIAVSEGTVVLEGPGGEHTIGAGSGLLLSSEGEVLIVPQAVALFPVPGARFSNRQTGSLPVGFNWNKINYSYGGLTRLEVAYDRSFNRIRFAEYTSASELILPLPEGTWFWRLRPESVDPQLPMLPYSRLTIVYSPVPSLISPMEGQVFSFRSRPPALRFQWSASPGASFYLLEAADNPLLHNPALSIQVRALEGDRLSSFVSSVLEEGRWYWRVTPVYSRSFAEQDDDEASSLIRPFVIQRGAPLLAPVPVAPLNNAQLNIETGRRDIIFSWRRENEAVSYRFRVSSNRDMSSPIIEQTLTKAFFRYGADKTLLSPGTWYWTVQQIGYEGDISPASLPRAFTALQGELVQRPVFPPDNFVIAENLLSDIRFTWRTNLPGTRFQVSQSPDFTDPLVDEFSPLEKTHNLRSLQSGLYYWRIISELGEQQHESPAHRFVVADPLPPPELGSPESALALSETGDIIISAGQPVVAFNWEATPGAAYYLFRLYREGAPETPVLETMVSGTSFSVNMGGLGEGPFTWSVQALARESLAGTRRTGFAAAQMISLRQLRTVNLQYPRDGWAYEGIIASRNPGMVRWYSPETTYNTVFTLARDAQMTYIVARYTGVPREHALPRLNAGDFFWTIQAEDSEGFDISSPYPAHFRVLPITPLPVPANRMPGTGHTITPAQIMASRSVAFSWNSVPGANAYMLTIFREDEGGRVQVIQTPVLRQTAYTVEDIRLLGRGNFLWQVEALYVDRGFIEQRGYLQENALVVDIPLPQHIRILDTGVLYGR